jgi:hypothetical protein
MDVTAHYQGLLVRAQMRMILLRVPLPGTSFAQWLSPMYEESRKQTAIPNQWGWGIFASQEA